MERSLFLASLLPPNPDWLGTGALYRPPQPTDWSMLLEPAIAQGVHQGVTNADLTQYFVGPPYNQGSYGACVAASWCTLGSVDEVMLGNPWPVYDWLALYQENGGVHDNGVDTQQVAKDLIANGYPGVSPRQKVVASYLWAPQTPGLFRQTLKAALAAGRPCKLALLLPSQFGWNSSGGRTSGYHEVCLLADDGPNAICGNSWGPNWPQDGAPKPGLCRLPWDYLEADNCQNGYCYGVTVVALDNGGGGGGSGSAARKISGTATGTAQGAGSNLFAVGQSIPVASGAFSGSITITQIDDGGGGGGGGGNGGGGGGGTLQVNLARGRGYLAANVQDGGKYLAATCDLTLGGVDKGTRQTTPSGATAIAAIWSAANVPAGTVAVVDVTAADGRSGTGSLTL